MSYQRTQLPSQSTDSPQFSAADQGNQSASPFMMLQGLMGNAGLLDLLRPQMPATDLDDQPAPLTGALQSVLQQDASTPTPPPGGAEAPSNVVATSLSAQGQAGALTSAPSSPALSSAAQVEALDQTTTGVEGTIADSPALTTAVAAELGTTPSEVQSQANPTHHASWWDDAVDWTVDGVGGVIDAQANVASKLPGLGGAAGAAGSAQKFGVETLGGFAKGAGDMIGGIANMVLHPVDFLGGLATMARHIPNSPARALMDMLDVAQGGEIPNAGLSPEDRFAAELAEDATFWRGAASAIIEPYTSAVEQGKYGDALGRGIFDIGSFFVGAGEAKAATKGAEIAETLATLNKVDDSVKVASRMNELGAATTDAARAGNKAETLTKATGHADEVADLSKAEDANHLPTSKESPLGPSAEESRAPTPDRAAPSDAPKATETRSVDDLAEAGQEPLRKVSPEALDARIGAIEVHPLLSGDLDQLQKVIYDAKLGQSGALGELQALERWLAEGKPVEVLTEVQNAGLKNPDYRVCDRLTEVKTRVKPLAKNYIKEEIRDANRQVKRSGTGEVGQVEIQLEDAAVGADIAAIESQVRSQFHSGTSSSLDRVAVYQEGELIGEWVRSADGSVIKTFPADGVSP